MNHREKCLWIIIVIIFIIQGVNVILLANDLSDCKDRQTLIVQNIIKVAKGEDVKLVV